MTRGGDVNRPQVDIELLETTLQDDGSTIVLTTLEAWIESSLQHRLETFVATTSPDVTYYEWFTQDGRIEGRNLHEDWIREQPAPIDLMWTMEDVLVRLYDRVAVICYTLRIRALENTQVMSASSDETVVMEEHDGAWIVVHVHKSPHNAEPI